MIGTAAAATCCRRWRQDDASAARSCSKNEKKDTSKSSETCRRHCSAVIAVTVADATNEVAPLSAWGPSS